MNILENKLEHLECVLQLFILIVNCAVNVNKQDRSKTCFKTAKN